jgi:hypothetical protein
LLSLLLLLALKFLQTQWHMTRSIMLCTYAIRTIESRINHTARINTSFDAITKDSIITITMMMTHSFGAFFLLGETHFTLFTRMEWNGVTPLFQTNNTLLTPIIAIIRQTIGRRFTRNISRL